MGMLPQCRWPIAVLGGGRDLRVPHHDGLQQPAGLLLLDLRGHRGLPAAGRGAGGAVLPLWVSVTRKNPKP